MSKRFIISEQEKQRILGLHENAIRKEYLGEQYDPTQEALVVGDGSQPVVIFNKKTKRAVRLGNFQADQKVRLDPANPQNRIDAENLAKDPLVKCQYNIIVSTRKMPTEADIAKCVASTTAKKPVTSTPCPVGKGTKKEVQDFQDWLDINAKGWLPSAPQGLNKDPKKGYGSCGPNTRKAWEKNKLVYSVRFEPKPIAHRPEDDEFVVPDETQKGVADVDKQTNSLDQKRINAARNTVNYKDEILPDNF